MSMGVGSLSQLQKYVGIPYEVGGRTSYAVDCWGLCCAIYGGELGIQLPDWVLDEDVDLEDSGFVIKELDSPADFCLVRCERIGNAPDHWGIYVGGGVFSADRPSSNYVPLAKFIEINPRVTYLAVRGEDDNG